MRFLFTSRIEAGVKPRPPWRLRCHSRTKQSGNATARGDVSWYWISEDGLPDPVKAMGQILVNTASIDPKLALDHAYGAVHTP